MQIIQLALVTLHCAFLGLNSACNLPRVLFIAGVPQVSLFFYMFCSFYIRSYTKQADAASTSPAVKSEKARHVKAN